MKFVTKYSKLALMALACVASEASAQMSNAIFFMNGQPQQHFLNPAFRPERDIYVGIPLLSADYIRGGNNDLTFEDIYQNITVDGKQQTVLFFDSRAAEGSTENLLSKLKDKTSAFVEHRVNILDGGMYYQKWDSYLTVSVANRSETNVVIPKELPIFLWRGMNEGETYNLNVGDLSVRSNFWTELSLGISHKFSDQLTLGGNVKYLYGQGGASSDFKDLTIEGNDENWTIKGDPTAYINIPGYECTFTGDGRIYDMDMDLTVGKYFKHRGNGASIDLGAAYDVNEKLKLSASLLDLGFIRWTKGIYQLQKRYEFDYNGLEYDINRKSNKTDFNLYKRQLKYMFKHNQDPEKYTTMLTPKVVLGGDYSLIEDKLGVGALSKTYFFRKNVYEEFLLAAHYKPIEQVEAALTYNMFDGEWNNIGFLLNFNFGHVNFYCGADNIAFNFAKSSPFLIPSTSQRTGAVVGVNLLFGNSKALDTKRAEFEKKSLYDNYELIAQTALDENAKVKPNAAYDKDLDGVPDSSDICPDTPLGIEVDMDGCPFDGDHDGVPDYMDRCPGTPNGYVVDAEGCTDMVATMAKRMADSTVVSDSAVWRHAALVEIPKTSLPADVQDLLNKATYGIKFYTGDAMGIEPESYDLLNKIAAMMKRHRDYYLYLVGHVNLIKMDPKLSEFVSRERVQLVRRYLILRGVSPHRIATHGEGAHKRVATDRTTQGRQLNRRVDVTIWRKTAGVSHTPEE